MFCDRFGGAHNVMDLLFHLLLCEGSFCGTLRFFISFSMELEEADCLELWCLKQLGYFLSRDCSLLALKHEEHH